MENQNFLSKPIKLAVDKYALLPEFLKVRGLVKEHIISFDNFIKHEITKAMKENDLIVCAKNPNFYLRYINVFINVEEDDISPNHNPHTCRLFDCTYDAPIKAEVEYTKFNKEKKDYEKLFKTIDIGRMSIMLRSNICALNGKDEAELAKLGECPLDPGGYFVIKGNEKDYMGNKRLKLPGKLLGLLFEDLFRAMNSQIARIIECTYDKDGLSTFFIKLIRSDIITNGLERAISTGNWDLSRFKIHGTGVSQNLSRLSFIATLGSMTRISSQFEKTRKICGPRALHSSQWGMICPCDTPEGDACGLTKSLALLTHVTTDEGEGPLIDSI